MDDKNKKLAFDIAIFALAMILIQIAIIAILRTYFFRHSSGLIGAISSIFLFGPIIIFLLHLRNKK